MRFFSSVEYLPMANYKKSSRGRLVLAITLIAASLISAFIFSSLANQKTNMIDRLHNFLIAWTSNN